MRFFPLLFFVLWALQASAMTLEEKVGQVLMVHFYGREEAEKLIQKLHVGGVIYYNWANDLDSQEVVKSLSADIQSLAKVPLFIAADQEGGKVQRLHFTKYPSNAAVGKGDPALAQEVALRMGKELREVGINLNFAPVVDVGAMPLERSFGEDVAKVTECASQALVGYEKAGVIACLKHFPGHGGATADSHHALPTIAAPVIAPFTLKAPMIMTGHLLVPTLDPENCATLSKKTLNYLRQDLKFEGVVISDSLVMQGVLTQCDNSIEKAAIAAFNAGCDILLLGGRLLIDSETKELRFTDIENVHQALVRAVRTGAISEARLDASLSRILKLKASIK